jgi:Fe-S cluster assembly protein SufD
MEDTITTLSLIDTDRSIPVEVNALAKSALETMRWPTTRDEDWKYTRTARITKEQWAIVDSPAQADWASLKIDQLDAWHLVILNGRLDRQQSQLPDDDGITISEEATEPTASFAHSFEALQAAYCTGQLHIRVAPQSRIAKSIHVIHYNDGHKVLSQPTIQVTIGAFAEVHFVESFGSNATEQSFGNRKLAITVGENAHVAWDKIQDMHDNDFLMNDDRIAIAPSANFTINTLTVDGGWTRNQLAISLDGSGIEASLNGCYLPRRNQLVDNHTKLDHRFPHCNSHELYKGLLDDSSTGVFNGKVYVHLDAQKTNAYQNNANILLSEQAQMNTKPELEIYADDVRCSHGTTTGQMDEEALFYLQSRGLSYEGARKLLTTAFINDVLAHVENTAVREHVARRFEHEGLLYL